MILPFKGNYPVSRGFVKYDPQMPRRLWDPFHGPTHRGIDYVLPSGTPVVAVGNGSITNAGWSPDGAGNIVILHIGSLYVKYFHLSSVSVKRGQQVKEGEVVGVSGSSGNSTGPHLDFQVEQGIGNAVDPAPLITSKEDTLSNPTPEEVKSVFRTKDLGEPSQAEINRFSSQPWDKLVTFVVDELYKRWANTRQELEVFKAGNAVTHQQAPTHWQTYKGSDITENEMNDVVNAKNGWGAANGYLLQYNFDRRKELEREVEELKRQRANDAQEKIIKIKELLG